MLLSGSAADAAAGASAGAVADPRAHVTRPWDRALRRALRGAGALLAIAGLVVVWVLRIDVSERHIYVSGFGAEGEPNAALFNLALGGIGVGGILIGIAALALPRTLGPVVAVGLLLIGCGVCFVLSSRITCSAGCPVPFTEGAGIRDAVHVSFAVLGFGAAGLAMLLSHRFGGVFARLVPPAVAALAIPALAGALLALLGTNARIGGWLELIATTAGILWLIAFALVLGSPGGRTNRAA